MFLFMFSSFSSSFCFTVLFEPGEESFDWCRERTSPLAPFPETRSKPKGSRNGADAWWKRKKRQAELQIKSLLGRKQIPDANNKTRTAEHLLLVYPVDFRFGGQTVRRQTEISVVYFGKSAGPKANEQPPLKPAVCAQTKHKQKGKGTGET